MNVTKYGVKWNKTNISEYFSTNPKESKLYLDYNLFDSVEDLY